MNKALILIGYQNDYFAHDGILRSVVKESSKVTNVIENTVQLLKGIDKDVLLISTPIIFSENYKELSEPVGILKTIKEVGAFKAGSKGAETIDEIKQFDDSIIEIPGKLGLNAFVGTNLEQTLRNNDIEEIIIAGTVASICIDSTGRSAFEKGFKVSMLSDCISGRTVFEKDYFVDHVYPLYANVYASKKLISEELNTVKSN
ncbi:MAG: cysteine hydrolase [Flavobacteriaceae bacterium]|nr:cysteine hydrolase [Bacteroidia bacterium]MBT8289067.1 cysteine hydrolase [Bacteroidia bacterium]NNF74988.1 cysteine hydrolase [Flavobacteriaceae bacterium]NNK71710.1 cysteine hydrolase [Flavobacteriaceae bacterium]